MHLEGDVMQEVIGAEGCSGLGGDAGGISISAGVFYLFIYLIFSLLVWESLIGCR